MKEALEYVDEGPYKCVIFSDDPHFFPAYIFVIFYTRYSPDHYQSLNRSSKENLWMYTQPNLDKYFMLNLTDLRLKQGQCLLIIRPRELPEIVGKDIDVETITDIQDFRGDPLIKLVQITGRGR